MRTVTTICWRRLLPAHPRSTTLPKRPTLSSTPRARWAVRKAPLPRTEAAWRRPRTCSRRGSKPYPATPWSTSGRWPRAVVPRSSPTSSEAPATCRWRSLNLTASCNRSRSGGRPPPSWCRRCLSKRWSRLRLISARSRGSATAAHRSRRRSSGPIRKRVRPGLRDVRGATSCAGHSQARPSGPAREAAPARLTGSRGRDG